MQRDVEFLRLEDQGEAVGRFTFTVADHLTRPDGQLYGGTAIAVSMTTAALVSGRRPIWMTTQFVSSAGQGQRVAVHAEVLAEGRRTDQVRVTATTDDGATVFASLGATADERPNGLSGQLERAPQVPGPDDIDRPVGLFDTLADRGDLPAPPMPQLGFMLASELRVASTIDDEASMCMWARRRDGQPITAAVAAYLADLVPMGISRGLGVTAAGISLDNTIRIGDFVETEWILLQIRPHMAAGGYGHGTVHVWSPDGTLMATATQTATMFEIDMSNPPWAASPGA